MKKIFNYLTVLITICGLTSNCNNHHQPDGGNDITFDTIEVNKQYFMLGDTLNPHCDLDIKYIYPKDYYDKDVLQKIQEQFIVDFFGENYAKKPADDAVNHYAQKYIADYKDIEKDFAKDFADDSASVSSYGYYESTHNEIKYNKFDIISYCVIINYYTGGAHGSNGCNNHVIDLKSGNKTKEEDLFIDNYQEPLAKMIVKTLLYDYKAANEEKLEEMGFFNTKEIFPNNNFYIDDEGITYTYNEYEIAPYSMGKIDVKIPYEKIRNLLRKDCLIMRIKTRK
jgi:hypothetical protein